VVISADKDDLSSVYGGDATAKDVLYKSRTAAPADVRAYPAALGRYSPHKE
jgi:hypothetical protein